jgi:hypothetical protein
MGVISDTKTEVTAMESLALTDTRKVSDSSFFVVHAHRRHHHLG